MLFLIFQLERERYALEAAQIVEVLPLVRVKKIPQAPIGVAGVFDYRGAPVPLVDLSQLALGRAAEARLSTRIVLIKHPEVSGGRIGLIVEKVTGTLRRELSEFIASGMHHAATPFLGPVAIDARGMVQRIELDQLLPASVRDVLRSPAGAAT